MKAPRKQPDILDLFTHLIEACLGTLSPNAWKTVTLVAFRVIDAMRSEWRLANDPSTLLDKDIHRTWPTYPGPPSPRDDLKVEVIVSDSPASLFPVLWAARISLTEMSYSTRLARSSVVQAVREAQTLGVLKRAPQRSPRLDYMRTLYAIDWNWVLAAAKKTARRRRRRWRRDN